MITSSTFIITFPGGMGTEAEVELALAKERIVLPVITKVSDYENPVIKKIISDTSNMNQIKSRTTGLYHLIDEKKVIEIDALLLAIHEVIDGKE